MKNKFSPLSLNVYPSKCIWYEGIRDGFNRVYESGEPKPLPLEDISLLNEMCPNIATREGHLFVYFVY